VWSLVSLALCWFLSGCPHSKRKTAWAINTKVGRHAVHGSCSVCIDPEVKRLKVRLRDYQIMWLCLTLYLLKPAPVIDQGSLLREIIQPRLTPLKSAVEQKSCESAGHVTVCTRNSKTWSWSPEKKASSSRGAVISNGVRRKQCCATFGMVCLKSLFNVFLIFWWFICTVRNYSRPA